MIDPYRNNVVTNKTDNNNTPEHFTTGLTPHRCPICSGCGNVPGGFYNAAIGQIESWSSSTSLEQCRQCVGTGIIWG